jgi:phosphoserine aminotransferase
LVFNVKRVEGYVGNLLSGLQFIHAVGLHAHGTHVTMLHPNELNFSAGPGVIPTSVLSSFAEACMVAPNSVVSVLGISHRSEWAAELISKLENQIRELYGLSDDWAVLFMQGGATHQFVMMPFNFLAAPTDRVGFITTGYWSKRAMRESSPFCTPVEFAGLVQSQPFETDYAAVTDVRYLHYVSNETVEGVQFWRDVVAPVPVVCDMSSDFVIKEFNPSNYTAFYAHCQKNLGATGVTIVCIRKDALTIPEFDHSLSLNTQYNHHSVYNTPPVAMLYLTSLMLDWVDRQGGVYAMSTRAITRSNMVYDTLLQHPRVYKLLAPFHALSSVNVVFDVTNTDKFLQFMERAGIVGIAGHRSASGIRVSLYAGITDNAVNYLIDLLREYALTQT